MLTLRKIYYLGEYVKTINYDVEAEGNTKAEKAGKTNDSRMHITEEL